MAKDKIQTFDCYLVRVTRIVKVNYRMDLYDSAGLNNGLSVI